MQTFTLEEFCTGVEVLRGVLEKEAGKGATGCWGTLGVLGRDEDLWCLGSLSGSDSPPLRDLSSWAKGDGREGGENGYYNHKLVEKEVLNKVINGPISTSIPSLLRGNQFLQV